RRRRAGSARTSAIASRCAATAGAPSTLLRIEIVGYTTPTSFSTRRTTIRGDGTNQRDRPCVQRRGIPRRLPGFGARPGRRRPRGGGRGRRLDPHPPHYGAHVLRPHTT